MELVEDGRVEAEIDVEVLVVIVVEQNWRLPRPNRIHVDA